MKLRVKVAIVLNPAEAHQSFELMQRALDGRPMSSSTETDARRFIGQYEEQMRKASQIQEVASGI